MSIDKFGYVDHKFMTFSSQTSKYHREDFTEVVTHSVCILSSSQNLRFMAPLNVSKMALKSLKHGWSDITSVNSRYWSKTMIHCQFKFFQSMYKLTFTLSYHSILLVLICISCQIHQPRVGMEASPIRLTPSHMQCTNLSHRSQVTSQVTC